MLSTNVALRLIVAALCGASLGLEREYHQKPAGLRTNMLIAIGSALFTLVSIDLAPGASPDRIAAQVVTGIGFLGGGAIIRERGSVHGMTTAATIWVNSAVGMAAGAGHFQTAIATTVFSLVVLALLLPIERYFERRHAERP